MTKEREQEKKEEEEDEKNGKKSSSGERERSKGQRVRRRLSYKVSRKTREGMLRREAEV